MDRGGGQLNAHPSEMMDSIKSCHNAMLSQYEDPWGASSHDKKTHRCSGVQRLSRRRQLWKNDLHVTQCLFLPFLSAISRRHPSVSTKRTDLHIYRLVEVLILHLRRSRSTPIRAQVHSVRRSMQDPHAPAEPARHDRHRDGDRDDAEPRKHPKPKLPPIHVERSAHRD